MQSSGRGNWPEFVNASMHEAESEAIRLSMPRDRPYGTESWTRSTAAQLGLQSSFGEDYPLSSPLR